MTSGGMARGRQQGRHQICHLLFLHQSLPLPSPLAWGWGGEHARGGTKQRGHDLHNAVLLGLSVSEEHVPKLGSTDLIWSHPMASWPQISDESRVGRTTHRSTVNA